MRLRSVAAKIGISSVAVLVGCFSSNNPNSPLVPGYDAASPEPDATMPMDAPAADDATSPEAAATGDASPDAGVGAPDGALDAAPDAVAEAGPDATVDAASAVDAAPDAVAEAGPDATVDAGPDGPFDAAPDVVAEAGPNMDAACTVIGFQDDAQNCGYCGNSCGASGACTVGRCTTVLAKSIASAQGLAVDSNGVYFAAPGDNNCLYAVPLTGGTPSAIVTPSLALQGSQYVTLTGGNVYWTIANANNQQVRSVPTAGGAAGSLSTTEVYPQFITNDGVGLYWTDQSRIRRAELADGGLTTLSISYDAGNPFQNVTGGIAVDATYVYWASYTSTVSQVFRANKTDGSGVQLLATTTDGIAGITIDATSVYFTTFKSNNTGIVYSVPVGGGAATPLYTGEGFPMDIVSDATTLYWVNNFTSQVRKGPKAGGTATTLAQYTGYLKSKQGSTSATASYAHLVVDSTYVYWLDQTFGNGALLKTAKN